MSIGQRIAQKRKEQGLSQEALGARLGVSRQSIYKWESETALPEIEKLVALSRLFGVSVGWLLGVEDAAAGEAAPAAETPAAAGELTEAQLSMVEKIAERYIAAQPKPKKSAWDKWSVRILFVMCGAMLGILAGVSAAVRQLDSRYNDLQNSVNSVTSSVNSQIGGISDRVESLLKAQNNLTADYSSELLAADYAASTATFYAYAMPRLYAAGIQAVFIADSGSGPVKFPGQAAEQDGRFYAEITAELTDSITLSVVFTYPDGTGGTQLLDTYEGLYSESLPEIDMQDCFMFTDLSADGTLVIPGGDGSPLRYLWLREVEKSGAAAAADIRVGLFKNRALLAWAEPCEKPASFQGFDEYSFFSLPDLTVSLAAGDELCVAAIVTDEYGRVSLAAAMPYTPDGGHRLTRPDDIALDTDLSHWSF